MATSSQITSFINQIAPLIQNEAKKRGYQVASPIIAQAIVESAAGTSLLASKYHNYFGLKAGNYWKGKSVNLKTKEEYNSKLVSIRDNFRVFSSMEEGVKGYFDFINTKRYSNLHDAPTAQIYLELIKSDGYCTSSQYVSTCMSYVNKYKLATYDTFGVVKKNPYRLMNNYMKKGSKGESVQWVQYQLNLFGYDLVCDGDFGVKTEAAVKDFQKRNVLRVDGIVGNNTINKLKEL